MIVTREMPPTSLAASIAATAHLSVLSLIAGLILLPACTGEVLPPRSETNSVHGSPTHDASGPDAGKQSATGRDAGAARDARTPDARRPDARAPLDVPDELDDGSDDDAPVDDRDEPTDVKDPGAPDAGVLDAGRVGTGSCANNAEPPLARGLKLRELALYQTVKVALYQNGTWTTNTAVPIVAGKKALVRAFVDTLPGYGKHPVRAVLTLQGAQGTMAQQDERTIAAASTDADAASTFSFEIDPAKIAPDTQLSLSLQETDCSAAGGMASDARLPTTGTRALGAQAIGKLKVVVLPIEVGGRLPKTDEAELAKIRAMLLAYYPVPAVELTVRATPVKLTTTVAGTDSRSWTNTLDTVLRERNADRPPSDVYYFGLMQPAASLQAYCGRGCILGIAPQTTRVSPGSQVGLGASFADEQSYETIVHELGHAHGRGHAPCVKAGSIDGVDGSFPEKTGGIGDWGWDNRSNKLISPTTHKDVMGYCSPNWISAYTYAALAARSKAVNTLAFVHAPLTPTTWRNVLLYDDGSARWGSANQATMPGGELETATVLDAAGSTVAEIEVVRLTLSHTADRILYLPSPGPSWDRVVLGDRTLKLSDLLPAP
jgi:hypothetical protein